MPGMTTALQRIRLKENRLDALPGKMWQLLELCFHVSQLSKSAGLVDAALMDYLRRVEQRMDQVRQGLMRQLELVDIDPKTWAVNCKRYEQLAARHPHSGRVTSMGGRIFGTLGYQRTNADGRIHIAFGYLFDTDSSAWTIVHEASHKFCKTDDKAYIKQDAFDKSLSPKILADNADSYAAFAAKYQASVLWG